MGLADAKAVEVAKWLSPKLDFDDICCSKLEQCERDTGEWFFESREFQRWADTSVAPTTLWCVGGHEHYISLKFLIDAYIFYSWCWKDSHCFCYC